MDGLVRAVIERQGRCREERYSEPYARLDDGRLMPMGWNLSGPIYPVGTTGTAQYVATPNAGLWRFTPDEEIQ